MKGLLRPANLQLDHGFSDLRDATYRTGYVLLADPCEAVLWLQVTSASRRPFMSIPG